MSASPAALERAPLSSLHSSSSTRAMKTGSLAARARRNRLLVTDCYGFNEPEEKKKFEGCRVIQVCCSVCQIHANSDNSQMFGSSFVKEIYGRCRARKSIPRVLERQRWAKSSSPGGLLPSVAVPLPYLPLANVDGNKQTEQGNVPFSC